MLHDIFYFGALRIVLETATGKIVAVQDRITGEAADFHYSPEYIARAKQHADMAWSACMDACV